ncbi:MAG: DNA-processing protein DprA [Beijerinckiaceae bacterium]
MSGNPDASSRRSRLSETQLIDWLRLIRTEGIGPRTFYTLISRFGGAAEALQELPDLSRRKTGKSVSIVSTESVAKELLAARRLGAAFIARGDPDYPKRLSAIDSAPPLIAVIGPHPLGASECVSIVGSRNASVAGLRMAELLAMGLGGRGFAVVSGLARGIDARAHEASLPTGAIAVVAGGLDRLYPEENRKLFERLCDRGAVISEMPFGWEPRGRDFPRRNRIVAGLSLGTVVVEAARKSGSLITADFALQQNRTVFAVPGSPLDPRAEGPNDLIRRGATLVRNADDVADDLTPQREGEPLQHRMFEGGDPEVNEPLWAETDLFGEDVTAAVGPAIAPFEGWEEAGAPDARTRIMALLSSTPVAADEIARAAGLTAREVQIVLYDLDANGEVTMHGGGSVSKAPAAAPRAD